MNTPDLLTCDIARECCDFVDVYGGPAVPTNVTLMRRRVAGILSTIESREAAQTQSYAEDEAATDERHAIRERLFAKLRPVVTMAQTDLEHVPELGAMTLPDADGSAGLLILAANSAADVATRHAREFAGAGLDESVVAELRSLAVRLGHAVTARQASLAWRRRNTAEIVDEALRLRRALKVLDSVMVAWLEADSELVAHWKAVSSGRAVVLVDRKAS